MIGVYFSFDEIKLIESLFRKLGMNKEAQLRKLKMNKEDVVLANQIFEKIEEVYKFYKL